MTHEIRSFEYTTHNVDFTNSKNLPVKLNDIFIGDRLIIKWPINKGILPKICYNASGTSYRKIMTLYEAKEFIKFTSKQIEFYEIEFLKIGTFSFGTFNDSEKKSDHNYCHVCVYDPFEPRKSFVWSITKLDYPREITYDIATNDIIVFFWNDLKQDPVIKKVYPECGKSFVAEGFFKYNNKECIGSDYHIVFNGSGTYNIYSPCLKIRMIINVHDIKNIKKAETLTDRLLNYASDFFK